MLHRCLIYWNVQLMTEPNISDSLKEAVEDHKGYINVFEFLSNLSVDWLLDITRDKGGALSQNDVEELSAVIIEHVKQELDKPEVAEKLSKHLPNLYYWQLTTGFNF